MNRISTPHPYRWKMDAGNLCADCGRPKDSYLHDRERMSAIHVFHGPTDTTGCDKCGLHPGHRTHQSAPVDYLRHSFVERSSGECVTCGAAEACEIHYAFDYGDNASALRRKAFAYKVIDLQAMLGSDFDVMETPDNARPITILNASTGGRRVTGMRWTAEFCGLVISRMERKADLDPHALIHALFTRLRRDPDWIKTTTMIERPSVRPTPSALEAIDAKMRELVELKLRWAAEVSAAGLDLPGTPLADLVHRIGREAKADASPLVAFMRRQVGAEVNEAAPEPDPTPEQSRIDDLREWWTGQAMADVDMVAEKAVTYGSNSLEQLGRKMAQLNGRREVSAAEAQELGVWCYIVGKIERWTDAVMRGDRPKDDTLTDITAYAMMARRIRQTGGWPDGSDPA